MTETMQSTPEILDPPTWKVKTTDADGTVDTGLWTASRADRHIVRSVTSVNEVLAGPPAKSYHHQVDPATDASGGVIVSRSWFEETGFNKALRRVTRWEMEPVQRPDLSGKMLADVQAVADSTYEVRGYAGTTRFPGATLTFHPGSRQAERVACSGGFHSIAYASWRRLVDKGWLSIVGGRIVDGAPVVVTRAAYIALALSEHRMHTTKPEPSGQPPNSPMRMPGNSSRWAPPGSWSSPNSPVSYAVCSCGELDGVGCERRDEARIRVRRHKAVVLMTALGASRGHAEQAARRSVHRPVRGSL